MTRREATKMMTALIVVAAALSPWSASAQGGAKPARLRVFVTVPERNGVLAVTQESNDAVRELTNGLRKDKRLFELVSTRDVADITITLVEREVTSEESGQAFVPIGRILVARPTYDNDFRTVVDVAVGQQYRQQMSGYSPKNYKDSVKVLLADFRAWAVANEEKIRAMAKE